jgi:hypothetical protein
VSEGEWIVSERAEPNVVTRELAAGPTHINTVAAIVCLRLIHILCRVVSITTLPSHLTVPRLASRKTQSAAASGGHLRCAGSTQPSCAPCRPSTASSPPSVGRPTHRRRAATHFSLPASWPFPKSRKKATKPLEIRQHLQTTSSARTVAEDDVPGT